MTPAPLIRSRIGSGRLARHVVVFLVFVAACLIAGCSSGRSATSPSGTAVTQPLSATLEVAGPNPSISAKMVCAKEARDEIASSLGIRDTRVSTPTWNNHLYSCTYVYPTGSVTLSVKELVSLGTTASYFDSLARQFGRADNLNDLGQGAFIAKNGDAAVRKDSKVLLVDVHATPTHLVPLMSRADVAQAIAVVIMGCWSGA